MAKLQDRQNDPLLQTLGELLMIRRTRIAEDLVRKESPDDRGACRELARLLDKIFDVGK